MRARRLARSRGINVPTTATTTTTTEGMNREDQRDEGRKEKDPGWLTVTERRLISLAAPRQTTEAALPSQPREHTFEERAEKREREILNGSGALLRLAADIRSDTVRSHRVNILSSSMRTEDSFAASRRRTPVTSARRTFHDANNKRLSERTERLMGFD